MTSAGKISMSARKQPRALIYDRSANTGVGLPSQFLPNLTVVDGGEGVIKSYILPDNKTGVVSINAIVNHNLISDSGGCRCLLAHSNPITTLASRMILQLQLLSSTVQISPALLLILPTTEVTAYPVLSDIHDYTTICGVL